MNVPTLEVYSKQELISEAMRVLEKGGGAPATDGNNDVCSVCCLGVSASEEFHRMPVFHARRQSSTQTLCCMACRWKVCVCFCVHWPPHVAAHALHAVPAALAICRQDCLSFDHSAHNQQPPHDQEMNAHLFRGTSCCAARAARRSTTWTAWGWARCLRATSGTAPPACAPCAYAPALASRSSHPAR